MSIFPTTLAPPDPIFHLTASFKKSSVANKINLGVGAYRDDSGNPWVLPVVRKAELLIVNNPALDHEYLPIDGLPAFTHASVKLMLGDSNDKVAAAQTISGTGAVRLGADFLKRFCPADVYIPDPTWGNHKAIFGDAGLKVISYPYWDPTTKGLDFVGMIECLNKAAPKSIILFHPCAHNPTGVDPSQEQWKELASLCQTRNLVPFFDSAYQGFATTLDQDAWAVRYFVSQGIELLFCQSYSKNFGLYNERCGCLAVVTISTDKAKEVSSQLCKLIRAGYSNPPAFGARIVSLVLNTPELAAEWKDQLSIMSSRIISMRTALFNHLVALKTPGDWSHITKQIGMFSYTGLTSKQVEYLQTTNAVYMTDNGRISMAGLNSGNVAAFAKAVDQVVRTIV